jgi:hypothetical protein
MARYIPIGSDVLHKGQVKHVQDIDTINQSVRIGIPDSNDIVWDTEWVDVAEVERLPKEGGVHPGASGQ